MQDVYFTAFGKRWRTDARTADRLRSAAFFAIRANDPSKFRRVWLHHWGTTLWEKVS